MFDTTVSNKMIGELLWPNGVGVPISRQIEEFSRCELSCWALCWFTFMYYSRYLRRSSYLLFFLVVVLFRTFWIAVLARVLSSGLLVFTIDRILH